MPTIYIAGPMRGIPNWNKDNFEEAHRFWTERDWTVFNPSRIAVAMGYQDTNTSNGTCRSHLEHVMLSDIASIYASDAIALLPGWEMSTGAAVEVAMGQFLSLAFYSALTGDLMFPQLRPWSKI